MQTEGVAFPAKTMPVRRLSLLAVLAVGAYLRLWHLGSQIPFDDEWHAITFALEHDFWFLLTHYTRLGANSVPHNLYLWLALHTVGLSEWSIALPSLAAGILLLWYYPRWVWEQFGAGAGILSGAVLALAPFLVFYSRFARPYAPLLLLEFLAITHLMAWTRTARRYHEVSAVALGALAMWVQVTAAPPLFAAWTTVFAISWRARKLDRGRGPSPRRILPTALIMFAAACLLTLPAYLRQANPAPDAVGPFSLRTADTVSRLVYGTPAVALRVMLGGLTLFGLLLALRKAPRELAPLLAAVAASVATVLITHPLHSEIGAIFARYALPIFLLIPLGVAVAGQWIAGLPRTPAMRWFAGSAGLLGLTSALYFTGPLPFVYVGDASFTKHPAFQYDYADFDGTQSLPDPIQEAFSPLRRAQLHPFYAMLRLGSPGAPIIEYPFLLGQGMNRLYFAQMLHQRPVLAGYYASGAGWSDRFGLSLDDTSATRPRPQGFLMGEMTIDHALGHASPDAKKRFRTVIDVSDVKAIKASGAAYVILHWNLPREFLFLEVSGERGAARGRFVATIRDRLQAELGSPIVDDVALTVFKVR